MCLIPSNKSRRDDIHNWINKLLSIRNWKFTTQQYSAISQQKGAGLSNHIREFKQLGLIRLSSDVTDDEEPIYEIIDPRIKYLIARGHTTIEKI